MLVPSSSADFKALIGDKDAEDTSDLSECSSAQSDEEIEKELIEAINNVVPRSPRMSESETVESSFNGNLIASSKNIEDFRSTEKSCESVETFSTSDNKDEIIDESRNGDVKCTEGTIDGRNAIEEEIRRETKLAKNSSNDDSRREETIFAIKSNDTNSKTESAECAIENKQETLDSKSETEITDILLLRSRKDTSPDVPRTPSPFTSTENNFDIVTNDLAVLDFNEKEIFHSSETNEKNLMQKDIVAEEDKTTLYSLDVYSKEEVQCKLYIHAITNFISHTYI